MKNEDPFFEYEGDVHRFLRRAREQLRNFDKGNIESLFYAALELRFGIEARLYVALDSTFALNYTPLEKTKEHAATKLLKRLLNLEPHAGRAWKLKVELVETGEQIAILQYTPVTQELAKMHGQLGELLHFTFFRNKRNWYHWLIKQRMREKSAQSLVEVRQFLEDVACALEAATHGEIGMFKFPQFREWGKGGQVLQSHIFPV